MEAAAQTPVSGEVLSLSLRVDASAPGVGDTSVVGRLKNCVGFWRDTLKANKFVLDMIENGYTIPFVVEPTACYFSNNKSALEHPEFVREAIEKLLVSGVVREMSGPSYCCNPLTVATNKKLRLVLDLSRHVNRFVLYQHFKYEDWSVADQVVKAGNWMFTWDFTSGYHHLSINPRQCKYLGFSYHWPHGQHRYFEFLQLPFGLSSACYVYSKLTRPLIKFWRAQGVEAFMFIDDGLVICDGHEQAMLASAAVRSDIEQAGFIINDLKSRWEPATRTQWLGFITDTLQMKFYVTAEKVQLLVDHIDSLLEARRPVIARELAKFVGRAVSMERALGLQVRLLSRSAARLCASVPHWDDVVQMDDLVRREMRFLRERARYLNGQPIRRKIPDGTIQCFSDASSSGYGAYARVAYGAPLLAQGQWTGAEGLRSSTWRELAAVERSLAALQQLLAGCALRWHCDNAAAVRILQCGSGKGHLQVLALRVAEICLTSRISIFPVWIPRCDNGIADELSRRFQEDCDDWQLEPAWFRYLDFIWGPHTVDRFANDQNTQLSVFNSNSNCPGTSGVDAFAFRWAGQNNWLCPPITLVWRAFEKVQRDRAVATLVVPWWESAYFWPIIRPAGKAWHKVVTDYRRIPAGFVRGLHTSVHSAFSETPRFWTLALRLDGARS